LLADGVFSEGSLTGSFSQWSKPGGFCCFESFGLDDFYNPSISEIDIENGLLQGFHLAHGRHDWQHLKADFVLGTYSWGFNIYTHSGTLNRAPGYVSDVPEPETLTLLLLGFVAIAVFAGPSGREAPNRN
jgi:hypothetical protein